VLERSHHTPLDQSDFSRGGIGASDLSVVVQGEVEMGVEGGVERRVDSIDIGSVHS